MQEISSKEILILGGIKFNWQRQGQFTAMPKSQSLFVGAILRSDDMDNIEYILQYCPNQTETRPELKQVLGCSTFCTQASQVSPGVIVSIVRDNSGKHHMIKFSRRSGQIDILKSMEGPPCFTVI